MQLSISPTLLNAYEWYLSSPPNWKGSAFDALSAMLRREKRERAVSASRGEDFEAYVYYACDNVPQDEVRGSNLFREVVAKCRGGQFQTWASYNFYFEKTPVRAYGKLDVLLPDKVIDIKTTGRFRGASQYINGWQPAIYLLATQRPVFEFVIAEWENADGKDNTIKAVHSVEVQWSSTMHDKLVNRYGEFLEWLKGVDLYDDYVYTFCKNTRPSVIVKK